MYILDYNLWNWVVYFWYFKNIYIAVSRGPGQAGLALGAKEKGSFGPRKSIKY